jgi:hypothetical protein
VGVIADGVASYELSEARLESGWRSRRPRSWIRVGTASQRSPAFAAINAMMTATDWVALITGVLGFVIGVLNFFVSRAQLKHQQRQLEAELQNQREQFEAQLALSREQMLLDHPDIGRLHNRDLSAIQTLRGLLQDERYEGRPFATIRHHLPDRADEEIRLILRSMGAIRVTTAPELWRLPSIRVSARVDLSGCWVGSRLKSLPAVHVDRVWPDTDPARTSLVATA